MKFENLYKEFIELWPTEIDISDGYPVNDDGYFFPSLNKIYDNIEDNINHEKEHWSSICNWAFFQAFHKAAKTLKSSGKEILYTRKVEKLSLDKCIRNNLNGVGWENENKNYIGL